MNNSIFGDHVPTVPQWTGPPHKIVYVQAMLYASLATSLFSAFLAMLGKQWLNQYVSTELQGTPIEQSQNRQRKHNGIVVWHFHHVMESLPLMLQFALLLLGSALSLFIWGIDRTIASVVLGITVFGVTCYTFVIIAGAISMDCPYQTPGALILRYLWQKFPSHAMLSHAWGLVAQHPVKPGTRQPPDQHVAVMDFHCILWMLQTSSHSSINQMTLRYLSSIPTSPGFKATITADCFKLLTTSISITKDNQVMVLKGLEQLAERAAACLLSTISHTLIVDPKSKVLKEVYEQYNNTFPYAVDLQGLPFCYTISGVHSLFSRGDYPEGLNWEGVDPSTPENVLLAHSLVKVASLCSQGLALGQGGQENVPDWVLQFSLHCLLWSPKPPVSVITDCLSIVAIELGCEIPDDYIRSLDKRYVCMCVCNPAV